MTTTPGQEITNDATAKQALIADIEAEATMIANYERWIAERVAARDELIRKAMSTELRRDDIAAAARVKVARLYQIRDGRR